MLDVAKRATFTHREMNGVIAEHVRLPVMSQCKFELVKSVM